MAAQQTPWVVAAGRGLQQVSMCAIFSLGLIKHVINLFLPTFDFSTGAGSRTTARKGSKRRGSSPRDEGYNQVNICGFFSLGPFYHTSLIYFSPLLTSLQMQVRKQQRGSAANAEGRRRGTRGDIRVSACADSSLCQFY